MSNVASPEAKLNSFFHYGILPEGGDLDVPKSFDKSDPLKEGEKYVSLNCITHANGVYASLFAVAHGGLSVAVEGCVGNGGDLDEAIQRNEEKINTKAQEHFTLLKQVYKRDVSLEYCKAGVIFKVLQEDPVFLDAIKTKLSATALFIVKLDKEDLAACMTSGDCKEYKAREVPPQKIIKVIMSRQFENQAVHDTFKDKIEFVESVDSTMTYSYKSQGENAQIRSFEIKTKVPDYESAVKRILSNGDWEKKPIYTHMTRLW